MGRALAADTLAAPDAERVRGALGNLRNALGVTNSQIADRLGWDVRRVTNAMQSASPLRRPNAFALHFAMVEMRKAHNNSPALEEAAASWATLGKVSQQWPAALVASPDIKLLAALITDGIVARPGFSTSKRDAIRKAIEATLRKGATRFARSAWRRMRSAGPPAVADHALCLFGYHSKAASAQHSNPCEFCTEKRPHVHCASDGCYLFATR